MPAAGFPSEIEIQAKEPDGPVSFAYAQLLAHGNQAQVHVAKPVV